MLSVADILIVISPITWADHMGEITEIAWEIVWEIVEEIAWAIAATDKMTEEGEDL